MKINKLISSLFCTFLISFSIATAQQKSYRFIDETCEYVGTYNTRLYSEQQLRDTHTLYYGESWLLDTGNPSQDNPASTKQQLASLNADYLHKLGVLKGFKIIDKPIFTTFRDSLILSLNEEYKAKNAFLNAYITPESILTFPASEHWQSNYAIPLSKGGAALLQAYKQLTLEQMDRNADPQGLYKRYEESVASPERYKRAFGEVINYGWWNCVNASIPRPTYGPHYMDAYKDLFIKVKTIDCDEP